MRKAIFLLASLAALRARAAETPGTLALAVTDAELPLPRVEAALRAADPALRSAAARLALVRDLKPLVPVLRELLAAERNAGAAREEARALVVLGDAADVDVAITSTRSLPRDIDDAIARAAARRGDAFKIYASKLRPLGFKADEPFFAQAFWRRPALAAAAGARLVGMKDADGWRALLNACRAAYVAMPTTIVGASLGSSSPEIRSASVWYLVRAYLPAPEQLDEQIREAIARPNEALSMQEAFGREIVKRMTGGEKTADPRWLEFLKSDDADAVLRDFENDVLFHYFTDEEYLARRNHCGLVTYDCRMPEKRPTRTIPSKPVAQPEFPVPSVLPAGLGDAVVSAAGCRADWLATASADSDLAGRVQSVAIHKLTMDSSCERATTALMRLSLATPENMGVPLTARNILLSHARGTVCLDEAPVGTPAQAAPRRTGGDMVSPKVKNMVKPTFPESARVAMGAARNVFVIAETVISREGCVRSVTLLAQSPFPELNTAALQALSKWTFTPGTLNGVPVDARFNLSVNFKTDQ